MVLRMGTLIVISTIFVGGCNRFEPNHDLALRYLDALNSHDPNQVLDLLTVDATYVDPASLRPLGREALRMRLQQDAAAWKDRVYAARRILTCDNSVTIEWHIQQTHPSGESVPIDGATVLTLRDGRIEGIRSYYNVAPYLRFLQKQ